MGKLIEFVHALPEIQKSGQESTSACHQVGSAKDSSTPGED